MSETATMTGEEYNQYLFMLMGKQLLRHKYLYYVKNKSILQDGIYDMFEREYTIMARKLEVRPEVSLIADWNEIEDAYISSIVGFPEDHPWAQEIIDKED